MYIGNKIKVLHTKSEINRFLLTQQAISCYKVAELFVPVKSAPDITLVNVQKYNRTFFILL